MLRAAIIFFVLALLGILFGAKGFAGISMDIGKALLGVFLVLAVISFGSCMDNDSRCSRSLRRDAS